MQIIQRVKIWTEEEDNYIINNYLNMTDEEMGIILNRSTSAVKNERLKLNLKRPGKKQTKHKRYEPLSFDKIKQMFEDRGYILLSSEDEYKT